MLEANVPVTYAHSTNLVSSFEFVISFVIKGHIPTHFAAV
jgi:hypothetical protein